MYQALAKASSNSLGFSWKRLAILRYAGSNLRARSEVNMIGAWWRPATWASGTVFAAWLLAGIHWIAPAGLLVCTQS
ncbi:hypothetical protein D3C78_1463940 [compost metagenome]